MKKYTQEEYIEKCIKKHGDKYDLPNVVYQGMEKDVFPVCYKHSTFTINAWLFVNKCGCSICEEHNVPLYYINYNENVEAKLKEIIEKIQNG